MLKMLLFDFDGTLVNSMSYYADLAALLFVEHYSFPKEQAKHAYFKTSGIAFAKQLQILFPDHAANDKVAQLFEAGKVNIKKQISLYPHVVELLTLAHQMGYQIGISSSENEDNIRQFMQKQNIDWDVILGTRNQTFTKGKAHYSYLLENHHLAHDDILFIGDSLQDYKICAENEVAFVAYLSIFDERDFLQLHPKIPCYSDYKVLGYDLEQGKLFERARQPLTLP